MTSAGSWPASADSWRFARRRSRSEARRRLDPARLSERLRAVNAGYVRMESGSRQLQEGLTEGAAKLRAALWIEGRIGELLTGGSEPRRRMSPANLRAGGGQPVALRGVSAWPAGTQTPQPAEAGLATDPRELMLVKLTRAAAGAGELAAGAAQARHEVALILGRSRRSPGTGPALDHAGNHPRASRAATELCRVHHARRPAVADRHDPGRPDLLGRRHGPGGRPSGAAPTSSSATSRART